MKSIDPDSKRLPDIFANIPTDTPIIMINLLKFRQIASYPNNDTSKSGKEAYAIYSRTALKMVKKVGGKPFWMAQVQGCLIAPPDETWDEALLVQYPSIQAFQKMLSDPEYQECTVHRTAALEDSRLIATIQS